MSEVQTRTAQIIDVEQAKAVNTMRLPNPKKLAQHLADEGLLRDDTELNRLRRELEELVTSLERKADRAQRNRAYSAAIGYRETAKKITHILNQNGDEE